MKRRFSGGFTLIELLIVVAIIAILAAIAVPNFLEAQTRSKVSRAKADLRSLAVAVEAYYVDHNKAPREYSVGIYGDPTINGQSAGGIIWPGGIKGGILQHGVSTPVAYITNAFLRDPFIQQGEAIPQDEQIFTYHDIMGRITTGASAPNFFGVSDQVQAGLQHEEFYGAWRLLSIGPDRDYYNNLGAPGSRGGVAVRENMAYDATNGTVSEGNIHRSQKRSDSDQPPLIGPNILGPH